jgi:hypothetical protein
MAEHPAKSETFFRQCSIRTRALPGSLGSEEIGEDRLHLPRLESEWPRSALVDNRAIAVKNIQTVGPA